MTLYWPKDAELMLVRPYLNDFTHHQVRSIARTMPSFVKIDKLALRNFNAEIKDVSFRID